MAATMTESAPTMAAEEPGPYTGDPVEIRFPVHADEPPWTVVRRDRLEIELVGPGGVLTVELVGPGGVLTVELPAEVALDWTGALVAAIASARAGTLDRDGVETPATAVDASVESRT